MATVRQALLDKLWYGHDPLAAFGDDLAAFDLQGWNSQHPFLEAAIIALRPSVIVEVGAWKGGSTVFMADAMKRLEIEGVVISVDTWLGSSDHWMKAELHSALRFVRGLPSLYATFASNVLRTGAAGHVIPLPLDSQGAAEVLAGRAILADVIHLDAGHSYDSVSADLRAWWPLLRPGGILIGDDYWPEAQGHWPTVRQAFDDFFGRMGLTGIQSLDGKCIVLKLPANAPAGGGGP